MNDLSSLSDAELTALYNQQTPPSLSQLSDAQLKALYERPQVGLAEDIAKGAGSGLIRGGIGLAGLSGDTREAIASGLAKAAQLLPDGWQASPQAISGALRIAPMLGGPTGPQLQSGLESLAGRPLYQAQTGLGKIAQTAGEFAPALMGGPEALATKALTRVAVPAIASEAAGQLAEGTSAEPYARTAAALTGAVLAHRAVTPQAAKTALTADALDASASDKYKQVHALGFEIDRKAMPNLVANIKEDLQAAGKTDRNAQPVYDALSAFEKDKGPVTTRAFDNLRQEMVSAANNADGNIRYAGGLVRRKLDDYLAKIPASDVLKGDVRVARQLFGEARADYAAARRMQMAEGKVELGELNRQSANSGQNADNSMRQAIKQLIRPGPKGISPAERERFTPEAIAAAKKVVAGPGINALRWIGKLAPTDVIKLAIHGELGAKSGGLSLPLSAASLIAKKIADRVTLNRSQQLLDLLSSESPAGKQLLNFNSRLPAQGSAVNAGLLSALMALRAAHPRGGVLPDQVNY